MLQQNLPWIKTPIFVCFSLFWGRIYHQVRRYYPWQRVSKAFNRDCITYTNVIGQARRAIHAYSNDKRGYIFSLRRLKCVFGQKSKGAQAHLWKVSRGKKITSDDDIGLLDYYYTINNCLISLRLLQYESDLTSTKVLRQATRQLSSKRYNRCGEHCLNFRAVGESNLMALWQNQHSKLSVSTTKISQAELPTKGWLHHQKL